MSNGLEQFFITNGRTGIEDYIDLLEIRNGFCIDAYKPGKLQLKNGGTFADSPIADSRSLTDYRWSTIVDTLEYRIVSRDSDAYALASQIFDRLLIQAINYQAKRHGNPVYLGRRTKGETNITYAEVIAFSFSAESDFFNQPFSSIVNKLILSDRLTQAIEHGPWLENPPGEHTLVQAGSYQCLNLVRNSHLESFAVTFTDWTNISTPILSQSREFVEEGFYAGVIESSAGTEGIYQDIPQDHLLNGDTYTVQVRVYIEAGTFGIRASDFGAFTSPVVDFTDIPGWHTLEATKSLAVSDGMRISLEAIGAGSIGHVSWVKLCRYSGNVDSSGEEQPVTTRDIYFSNQSVEQGITHMYLFDGAAWTDNLLAVGPPFELNGTVAGTAAIYIGASNSLSRIFNSVVFNVGQVAAGATSYAITWQYWNGGWVDLDVRDNTDMLSIEGVNSVHWEMPTDWASVSLDAAAPGAPAVLGMWVRAYLSALTGAFSQVAEQHDRIPYAAISNYLEVAADQAIGVIPALAEIIEENTSDDSTAFPASDGASIRTILGLRSLSRGETFRGIINLSDTGNPPWITADTTGSLSVLANYSKAPSGRIFQYTYVAGSIPGVLVPELTITLARSEARSFFGTFRVYLRIDDMSANDSFRIQLQFPFSNGTNSSIIVVEETSPDEMYAIDLGEIKIPSGDPVADDLYDDIVMYLAVEPDLAQTFKFIDLWLIPTDELLLDSLAKSPNTYRNGEYAPGLFSALQIDSIHDPRRNWRSLLQYADESYIIASWQTIGGGPLILQPKQGQRFWFYNFNFQAENGLLFGRPEIANRAEIHRNARYTGIRGDD